MICSADGTSYRRRNGIWNLIPASRTRRFHRFVSEYGTVRKLEGRGSHHAEYFRRLPYADTTGRYARDWRIRARSYSCLVSRVVEPLERRCPGRRLEILDLGAGNGWMSNRLARRGHRVWALDLRVDALDGLGAHVHYDAAFSCIQAEFDRLPFAPESFDLVIFNASLHYSERYEETLKESIRVLREGGRIGVVDTPIYRSAASGARMVAQRKRRFKRAYGCASDAMGSEEYITPLRMRQISAETGITWSIHRPEYGHRWRLRRMAVRIRSRREPARFAVLEGRKHLCAEEAIASIAPRRILQFVGRAGLRLRYVTVQRHRLKREVCEDFRGVRLRIPPGVFHPLIFRTGAFLADLILDDLLAPGSSVLDLGTGSGICAIASAFRSADVTAVDINPKAVAAARQNAERMGVNVSVMESDLFEAVGRFDVVLFNPPYFSGSPQSSFDLAWRSDDVVERFSRALPEHLTEKGYALVVLSSDGRCADHLRRFEMDGHRLTRVAARRYLNETLAVFRLR